MLVSINFFSCSEKTSRISDNKFQPVGVELSPKISKPDTVSSERKNNSDLRQVNRFTVSFYSIGSGIEQKQLEKFELFLSSYRQKTSKKIPAEKTHWGREGETDFCVDISELSPSDQLNFIGDVKEELKTAGRVNYSENSPCKQQRR